MEIAERARRFAAAARPCVDGEGGCHNRLLSLAIALARGFNLSDSAVLDVLVTCYNPRCAPPWTQAELAHKVQSARSKAIDQADGYLIGGGYDGRQTHFGGSARVAEVSKPAAPQFVPESLSRVSASLLGTVTRAWLADRSPVAPHGVSAEGFLAAILEPGETVCVIEDKFNSKGSFMVTRPATGDGVEIRACANKFEREDGQWDLSLGAEVLERFPRRACEHGYWWLPQPVTGRPAMNCTSGRWSWRSETNVLRWRWMVLESDVEGFERQWVCVLAQLPVPIGAIYSSGGKSVHALLRVDAESKSHWDDMKGELARVFVELGADGRALSAVRLTRVPQMWRGGRLQALHFLDPECSDSPVVDMPRLRDVAADPVVRSSAKLRDFYRL